MCCLPGLGTMWPPSLLLHCGGHLMVVVDGLHCRCWWWWEGRSNNVAMFEPWLPHLGSHMQRWAIWCFSLLYSKALVAQLIRALLTLLWSRVQFPNIAVLITPPPIPTGLWESSRIPTGFQQNFQIGIFTFFFISPNWTPTGLLLDSCWTPTELKQMSQTESNGSDTGFLLNSYWSITITEMTYLTTLIN